MDSSNACVQKENIHATSLLEVMKRRQGGCIGGGGLYALKYRWLTKLFDSVHPLNFILAMQVTVKTAWRDNPDIQIVYSRFFDSKPMTHKHIICYYYLCKSFLNLGLTAYVHYLPYLHPLPIYEKGGGRERQLKRTAEANS